MKKNKRLRRALVCEQLETRLALSNFTPTPAPDLSQVDDPGGYHAVIVAGDPNGSPSDSPSNRVDANTEIPFSGVASIQISANRGTFICTGTPFDTTHVLTAAHCLDLNNDGKSDKKDGIRSVTVNWNTDIDPGTDKVDVQRTASSWKLNPNFTGFNRPSVNDDLAVITLSSSVPAGIPMYGLYQDAVGPGTTVTMVGYGRSGDGVNGYTTNASFTVKRKGENNVDAYYGQDDTGQAAANEVFRFDFDGPSGNGTFGGPTLGNDRETTLGGGDSGGPSFVSVGSAYQLAGVNTFTQGLTAPQFDSLGGGILVYSYLSWITTAGTSGSAGGGSGGGGQPSGNVLGGGHGDVNPVVVVEPSTAFTTVQAPADSAENTLQDSEDATTSAPLLNGTLAADPDSVAVVVVASAASSDVYEDLAAHSKDILNAFDTVLDELPPIVEG